MASDTSTRGDLELPRNDDEGLPRELDFWQAKQRQLVTGVVDYNLDSLSDLIRSGTIDLRPQYQRRERWNDKKRSLLIESFLMNVPVPPVFLNEDALGSYSVIDGKQRLSAIASFIGNELRLNGLSVFGELNGLRFEDLPTGLQAVLKTRATIRAVIVLRPSDRDIKYLVFRRLNTGGVSLNGQEIRNSVYPGKLNDVILELSESEPFHRLLRIEDKQRSQIWQQMRDAEFVLRYFTFRENWRQFKSNMALAMDSFMESNKKVSDRQIEILRQDFLGSVNAVQSAYGEYAFRRWVPNRNAWRNPVMASLFDAEMFACRGRDPIVLLGAHDAILEETKKLFETQEFKNNIYAATNTTSYFRGRIQAVHDLLDRLT